MSRILDEDNRKLFGLSVLIFGALLTLPFLGLGHFYTRGEPREALVAVAMMEQGNYVLPMFQGEMAFKPPMLHWLVALFSLPQGYVSEFTARMPSAIAFILMSFGFFRFFSRRYPVFRVFLATLILMTTFEVHRSAMTCRVDMVLTAFMVGGFLALYRWSEQDYKGMPWVASLLISGAILTKGPVGAILPCFALAVYMALGCRRLMQIVAALLKVSLLSAILPLCWYFAAYQIGGDHFLRLVMEENFGRFLGKMTYESHEHGALYNVPMLLSGIVPWSLLLALGLFAVNWKRLGFSWIKKLWSRFREMDQVRKWAILVAVCVFVFYCIPKSKRSVYLLPLYPFLSLLIAEYVIYMLREHKRLFRLYGVFIAVVGCLFSVLLIAVHLVDLSILGDSRSARRMISQLEVLQQMPLDFAYWLIALLPMLVAVTVFWKRKGINAPLFWSVGVWMAAFVSLDGLLNPAIKNSVPDYRFAQAVNVCQPDGDIYFYRPDKEETVYTVSFYLGDKVKGFSEAGELPERGYVMLRESNLEGFKQLLQGWKLRPMLVTATEFTSFRGNLLFYKFEKKN